MCVMFLRRAGWQQGGKKGGFFRTPAAFPEDTKPDPAGPSDKQGPKRRHYHRWKYKATRPRRTSTFFCSEWHLRCNTLLRTVISLSRIDFTFGGVTPIHLFFKLVIILANLQFRYKNCWIFFLFENTTHPWSGSFEFLSDSVAIVWQRCVALNRKKIRYELYEIHSDNSDDLYIII